MKGLELCERYFVEFGAPLIARKYPEYGQRIAAGMVGPGSECFGFDDQLSRDHDWGPSFCLWLNMDDHKVIGESLRNDVDHLPKAFGEVGARKVSAWGSGRTGVFEIGEFYKSFIGVDGVPQTLGQWRVIPEEYLATATNGRVFTDPLGDFTTIRDSLLRFYPEDIRLKKIAARCMTIAQAGQYNYPRCVQRGEFVAANVAEAHFITDVISLTFLLNRRYKPFYKWMHRALRGLPVLGATLSEFLCELVSHPEGERASVLYERKIDLMEDVCGHLVRVLNAEGLSDAEGSFLLDHGPRVHARIADPQLRGGNVWVD